MKITERYEEEGVVKFVYSNGLETAIKTIPTCGTDRNKAVLFVSSSVGCRQGCKFCHLKDMRYKEITTKQVIESCKLAIDNFNISDRYLKLSFMGMGEVLSSKIDILLVALEVFRYSKGKCLGIDGVDVGTSCPKRFNKMQIEDILKINDMISYLNEPINPLNSDRTLTRIFFSLHSVFNDTRNLIMPNSAPIRDLVLMTKKFSDLDIVFHYTPMRNINDSIKEVAGMVDFMRNFLKAELRMLKYNKKEGSSIEESERVEEIEEYFRSSGIKFKSQVSTGTDIKAACGQFICRGLEYEY